MEFLAMMEKTTPWQMAPRRKRPTREKRRSPLPRKGTPKRYVPMATERARSIMPMAK